MRLYPDLRRGRNRGAQSPISNPRVSASRKRGNQLTNHHSPITNPQSLTPNHQSPITLPPPLTVVIAIG